LLVRTNSCGCSQSIVADLALVNFDGAIRYMRLMPDDMKLQTLLRVVQSLSTNY
jgi:hypothetical protein